MVCRKKGGFSLIELLVVIAIIAILAAILFPIFMNAKESSKKSTCQYNLKQIGAALGMYTSDNSDRYPREMASAIPAELTSAQVDGAQTPQIPGLIYSLRAYVKSPKIWLCPGGAKRTKTGPLAVYDEPRNVPVNGIWPLVTIMSGPGLRKTTCNYWSWSFNRPLPGESGFSSNVKLHEETGARGKTPAEYINGYKHNFGAGGVLLPGPLQVDKIGQLIVEAYWPGQGGNPNKPFYAHTRGQNILYYDGRVKWVADGRSLND